jgi:hypothetical protein
MHPSVRQPASAIVPVVLSVAALCLVLGHAALYGVAQESDEGAAAPVFQLLAVSQLPFLACFVLRHVRAAPRATAPVLLVLATLWVCTIAAVCVFT